MYACTILKNGTSSASSFGECVTAWLLAVPVLLVALYVWRCIKGRRPHLRVSSLSPLAGKGGTLLQLLSHLPMALFTAAMVLMAVALARPRSSSQVEKHVVDAHSVL